MSMLNARVGRVKVDLSSTCDEGDRARLSFRALRFERSIAEGVSFRALDRRGRKAPLPRGSFWPRRDLAHPCTQPRDLCRLDGDAAVARLDVSLGDLEHAIGAGDPAGQQRLGMLARSP